MGKQPFRKPMKSMDAISLYLFSDHFKTFKYRLGSSFVTCFDIFKNRQITVFKTVMIKTCLNHHGKLGQVAHQHHPPHPVSNYKQQRFITLMLHSHEMVLAWVMSAGFRHSWIKIFQDGP